MYDKFKLVIEDDGGFRAEVKSFYGNCMGSKKTSAKEAVSDLLWQLSCLVENVMKNSEEIFGKEDSK